MTGEVDKILNNCSGMSERDRLIFDTLLNQRSELLASLRTIDSALYQVAFAYIGAFALCVPAIVTGSATIEQLEQWLWLVSFIVCQIVFIGAVYALLLVKSRNANLGLMAHVEWRINSIITRNYGQRNKVLFQSTTEISRYYLGKDGGVGWFCLYVPLLCVLSLGVGYSCFLSWGMAPGMSVILVIEVIFIAGMYVTIFRTSGLKSARRIIEEDYSEWLAEVGDESGNSSERERIKSAGKFESKCVTKREFMRRFSFTDRGNAANEDFAYAGVLPGGGAYGVVIDGATGLVELPLVSPGFATNAQWFSHTAGAALCRALEVGTGPEQALVDAVGAARTELEAALGCPADSLDPAGVPSATLALAVAGEKDVELWGLGDSQLAALTRDGELVVSTDEVLEALDEHVVELMVERSAGRDLTVAERRALVRDEVLANRRLRNAPGGYWCLDPVGAGLAHARRVTLPRAEVVAVAGMSDGIFRAFDQYGMASLAEWMPRATYFSTQLLCDRMRVLEAADAQLTRFPRMKVDDDASLFWLGA